MEKRKLVEVKNLHKQFKVGKHNLKAVDGVSFDIYEGETLGLVGESGCGKTTTGRLLKGLVKTSGGEIIYNGKDLNDFTKEEKFHYTQKVQMIFQDPYSSLNPRMTVAQLISEGLEIHKLCKSNEEKEAKVMELLEIVGLNKEHSNRYPHEFSGGQRQRIGIARTLALNPEFIVCDEPISALDVSIQAQIINLLKSLQKEYKFTYLFIAHNLSVVKYISDRVAVMYLGKIVELTESSKLYENPQHPYTQALLSAIPIPDPDVERSKKEVIIEGDLPSPINKPKGCAFRTRCQYANDKCITASTELIEIEPGHFVACHRAVNKEI